MRSASYLIMLTVASATGHYLFTAEPDRTATGVQGGSSQTMATAQPEGADATTPAPAAAKPEAAKEPSADAASQSEADKAAEKPADKAEEKGSAAKGSPQRFIPSEQVRADFDVSFPIDI